MECETVNNIVVIIFFSNDLSLTDCKDLFMFIVSFKAHVLIVNHFPCSHTNVVRQPTGHNSLSFDKILEYTKQCVVWNALTYNFATICIIVFTSYTVEVEYVLLNAPI